MPEDKGTESEDSYCSWSMLWQQDRRGFILIVFFGNGRQPHVR